MCPPFSPHLSVIHSRDLLATLHLLVAMVNRFQPDLVLPVNVSVEVIQCEVIMKKMPIFLIFLLILFSHFRLTVNIKIMERKNVQ